MGAMCQAHYNISFSQQTEEAGIHILHSTDGETYAQRHLGSQNW